jgi:hypothetical protein
LGGKWDISGSNLVEESQFETRKGKNRKKTLENFFAVFLLCGKKLKGWPKGKNLEGKYFKKILQIRVPPWAG